MRELGLWLSAIFLVLLLLLFQNFRHIGTLSPGSPVLSFAITVATLIMLPPGILTIYCVFGFFWISLWPDQKRILDLQIRIMIFVAVFCVLLGLFGRVELLFLFVAVIQIFYSASSIFAIRFHTHPRDDSWTMKWKLAGGIITIVIYSYVFEFAQTNHVIDHRRIGILGILYSMLWIFIYPLFPIFGMALGRTLSQCFRAKGSR